MLKHNNARIFMCVGKDADRAGELRDFTLGSGICCGRNI